MVRAASIIIALFLATTVVFPADWVIGQTDPNESMTLTTDLTVDGNVIIINNGRLTLTDGATLILLGSIILMDQGTLEANQANIRFIQSYSYQSEISAYQQSALLFTDVTINGNGVSYGIGLTGTATAQFSRVTVENGFATWALLEQASATLEGCVNTGEFVLFGNVALDISDCETVLLWITLFDGTIIDTTLPAPGVLDEFILDGTTPWAVNIPYSVYLSRCTDVMWALMARSGSSATMHDSTLRVVGSFFERDHTIEITGIANNTVLSNSTLNWGDISYTFNNTHVETWNYYCYGTTHLTLQQCVFGELLTEESGESWVLQSLCDGTGGYIGAFGNSVLFLVLSTNLSQTTSKGNATFFCYHSALLSPAIDATDNSLMVFFNAQYTGEPRVQSSATIFDGKIERVNATVGDTVSLLGTARTIAGPDSPFAFEGYAIDVGPGEDPTEWTPIDGLNPAPVRYGLLAEWNTSGFSPGLYTLRLSIINNIGDPVIITNSALLSPPLFTGDLDDDGDIDYADMGILLSFFGLADGGDLDGDGDTDQEDLFVLLSNWSSNI